MVTRNSGILGWVTQMLYLCYLSSFQYLVLFEGVLTHVGPFQGMYISPRLGASCNIGPKSLTAWTMVSHHGFTQWSHAISIFQEVIIWQVRRSESHKAWNFTHMLRALNSLLQWLPPCAQWLHKTRYECTGSLWTGDSKSITSIHVIIKALSSKRFAFASQRITEVE